MKTLFGLCLSVVMIAAVYAQPAPPDTLWTHEYTDMPAFRTAQVIPSFDGGLVFAGKQEFVVDTNTILNDLVVVKTDGWGNREWVFRIVGTTDTVWQGAGICPMRQDSSYLVMGQRYYGDTLADLTLIKLNRQGQQVWMHNYPFYDKVYVRTLTALENGTFLAGTDAYLLEENTPYRIYYNNIYMLDFNANGDTLWTRIWRGAQFERLVTSVLGTSDGGCLIFGADCPEGPTFCNALMTKLDGDGNVQWENVAGDDDNFGRICAMEVSDGYLACSNFYSLIQLERLDRGGQQQWVQRYEVETQRIEQPRAIVQAADGGVIIAGEAQLFASSRRAPVLIKTDTQGNMQWRMVASLATNNVVPAFCETADGKLVFAGCSADSTNPYDAGRAWMGVYAWPNAAASNNEALPEKVALYPNFPNPFNPSTEITFDLPRTMTVRIAVFNLLGQEVKVLANGTCPAGHHTMLFGGSGLSSGTYVCRLQTTEGMQAMKMLLLR